MMMKSPEVRSVIYLRRRINPDTKKDTAENKRCPLWCKNGLLRKAGLNQSYKALNSCFFICAVSHNLDSGTADNAQ